MTTARQLPANPPTELDLEKSRQIARTEGLDPLSDGELLGLVLGRGRGGMSAITWGHSLLSREGSLGALGRLRPRGLQAHLDLGSVQACRLAAAFELGRRVSRDESRPRSGRGLTQEQVVRWAQDRLAALDHEEVWVLCVNAQSELQSTWQVGRGGIHGCGLLSRDILTPVVRDAAAGFILVHNHPSGDPTPSREDISLTLALARAAATICIPLLDHVVVSRGCARSFLECGLLDADPGADPQI